MAVSYKHKGQLYSKTDVVVPYIKKDGSPTRLAVWETFCADCGERFEILSTARRQKPWFPNRRCNEHQRPGVKA